MIHFFRDIIDGPVYIAVTIISFFGIMAILGFMAERLKKKEEQVALVKDVESVNRSKLVISSIQLDEEKEENLKEEKENILEINSDEVSSPQITLEENSDVNKTSNGEEVILSINSSDVVVSEIVEEEKTPPSEEETHKIKDMTQVIDFGSTDSVEEEVEKI